MKWFGAPLSLQVPLMVPSLTNLHVLKVKTITTKGYPFAQECQQRDHGGKPVRRRTDTRGVSPLVFFGSACERQRGSLGRVRSAVDRQQDRSTRSVAMDLTCASKYKHAAQLCTGSCCKRKERRLGAGPCAGWFWATTKTKPTNRRRNQAAPPLSGLGKRARAAGNPPANQPALGNSDHPLVSGRMPGQGSPSQK